MADDESELALDDWGICRYCTMGIVVARVRTGRQFFGPFWTTAWVHADGGDQRCWAPNAHPLDEFDQRRTI